jgi:2-polyprenyl-3-methyl-5-hydroxy-6-metoxy-1,4-benzoquinol methylase
MLFNHPLPEPESLRRIYRDVHDPTYLVESRAREETYRRTMRQLHAHAEPPGALLDIGCYTGVFLAMASAAGWTTQGLELSSWAAEIARGLEIGEIHETPVEDLTVDPGSFRVVTLWDVVEHLPNPAEVFQAVHRCLEPGGVVGFSTHMVDSTAARLMGTRYPFFMDMHVVHFSRSTLRRLLDQVGFEILDIEPHLRILRVSYLLEKIRHSTPTRAARSVLERIGKLPIASNRTIAIGGTGLVNVFARKVR